MTSLDLVGAGSCLHEVSQSRGRSSRIWLQAIWEYDGYYQQQGGARTAVKKISTVREYGRAYFYY
jgi:hypothetical protein